MPEYIPDPDPAPLPVRLNQEGLPGPDLDRLPAVLMARYTWALNSARIGLMPQDIAATIGGQEGADTVAILGPWLERERMRGQADLAHILHLAAGSDNKALIYAMKCRLRWSDDIPPPVPPAPPALTVDIPGLTTQEPPA
jgi:hypothetical protein